MSALKVKATSTNTPPLSGAEAFARLLAAAMAKKPDLKVVEKKEETACKYPRGYDIFQQDDGTPLKPEEALTYLHTEKAKGHKIIPCSGECGNPCKNADKGCAGFDYSGGGCPGYRIRAVENRRRR